MNGSFSVNAWIERSRNRRRHFRDRDHLGAQPDTAIVLARAIGPHPAGTPISAVLADFDARITARGVRTSSFTLDAVIA